MGMEFPIAQSLLSEMIPASRRGKYIALMDGFWPLGFVAAGCLSYFLLPLTGWRSIFLVLALPAVFVLAIRFLIPESPRWLEQAGRREQADRVLRDIEARVMRSLGLSELPPPLRQPQRERSRPGFFSAFAELWSPAYRRRTLTVWGLWFFALLGFYGLTSWLSALLQQSGFAVTQSVYYTVLISLAGIPGFLCAAWLVESWGRKPSCVLMLLGGGAMAYAYGQTAVFGGSLALLIGFGLAMQFFLFGMWAVLYTYTPELYPTSARAPARASPRRSGGSARCSARWSPGWSCRSPARAGCSPSAPSVSASPPWWSGPSASRPAGAPWRSLPAEPARRRKTFVDTSGMRSGARWGTLGSFVRSRPPRRDVRSTAGRPSPPPATKEVACPWTPHPFSTSSPGTGRRSTNTLSCTPAWPSACCWWAP